MSWESSLEYYRIINQLVKAKLWWLHSAKCVMYSVDFHEIEILQHQWKWDELTKIMIKAWEFLENAWADMLVICTNTMHKMAEDMQKSLQIPIVHIADATAIKIKSLWLQKVWLLWTKFTMEQDFYSWRLRKQHWLDIIIPHVDQRQVVHDVIYNELCQWKVYDESKKTYISIINDLQEQWAEWVILWCTEIPLLITQDDTLLPVLDTTYIHAEQAVDLALS